MSDLQDILDVINKEDEANPGLDDPFLAREINPNQAPEAAGSPKTVTGNELMDILDAQEKAVRTTAPEPMMNDANVANAVSRTVQPGVESARVEVADALSEAFGLDREDVVRNYDTYASQYFGRSDPLTNAESIRESRQIGLLMHEVARLQFKRITVGLTGTEFQALEEAKSQMPAPDEMKRKLPTAFMKSLLENWPNMSYVMTRTAATAATFAAPSFALGAAAGAPLGLKGAAANGLRYFTKAFIPAAQVSGAYFSGMIEAGMMADDLYDLTDLDGQPVDPKLIRAVSLGVGALSGVAEVIGGTALLKSIPGIGTVVQNAALGYAKDKFLSQAVVRTAMATVRNAVGGIASETLTELGQEAIQDGGAALLKALESHGQPSRQEAIEAWNRENISEAMSFRPSFGARRQEPATRSIPTEKWIDDYINAKPERGFSQETIGEVMNRYYEVGIQSLILSTGLSILPTIGGAVRTSRVAKATVNNAIRDAVSAAPAGSTVEDIIEILRDDPSIVDLGTNIDTKLGLVQEAMLKDIESKEAQFAQNAALQPELASKVAQDAAAADAEFRIGLPEGSASIFDVTSERPNPQVLNNEYKKHLVESRINKVSPQSYTEFAAEFNRGFRGTQITKSKSAIDQSIVAYQDAIDALRKESQNIVDPEAKARLDSRLETLESALEGERDYFSELDQQDRDTLIEELSVDRQALKDQLDEDLLGGRASMMTEQIQQRRAEIEQIEQQITDLRNDGNITTIADILEARQKQIAQLEKTEVQLREDIRAADERRDTSESAALKVQLDETRQQLHDLQTDVTGIDNMLDIGQRAVNRRARRMAEMEAALDRLAIHQAELTDPEFRQFVEGEMTVERLLENATDPESGEASTTITEEMAFDLIQFGKQAQKIESQKKQVISNVERGINRLPLDYVQAQADSIMQPVPKTVDKKFRDTIETIQRMIDPNWRRSKTLAQLERAVDKFRREGPEGISKDEILNILQKPLNKWSIKDIEDIRLQVDILKQLGKEAWKDKKFKFHQKAQRSIDSVVDGLAKGVVVEPEKFESQEKRPNVIVGLWHGARSWTLDPIRLFDLTEGRRDFKGELVKLFVNERDKAKAKQLSLSHERITGMREFLDDKGYDIRDLADEVEIGGETLTQSEAMGVWLGAKNVKTMAALVDGNRLTVQTIDEISAYVESNQMLLDVANEIRRDLREVHPKLRDTMITLTNEDMGFVENYMPMVRKLYGLEDEFNKVLTAEVLYGKPDFEEHVDKHFTKARGTFTPSEQKAIRTDLFGLWSELVPKQEQYINMAEQVALMREVMADHNVRMAILNKLGKDHYASIQKNIDVTANPSVARGHQFADRVARLLRRNTTVAYLAGKTSVILKQLPSSAFYAVEAGPHRVMAELGKFALNPSEYLKMVGELDPLIKYRASEVDQIDWQRHAGIGAMGKWSKFQSALMTGIRMADKIVVSTGHKAVYENGIRNGLSPEDALAKARNVTAATQPTGDRTNMAAVYNHNDFLNWALMFTQQLNKVWNMATFDMVSNAKNRHFGKMIASTMAMSTSAMFMWMISNRKLPSNEAEIKEALSEYAAATIPVVGKPILSVVQGYYNQMSPFFRPFTMPTRVSQDIQRGDIGGAVEAALEAAALVTGAPFSGPKAVVRSIAEKDPLILIFGKPAENEERATASRLY